MNQAVARCGNCGANLSLDDMRGQNCPYCNTVLPHHARAAEQAALVNRMLQDRGLAAQVPYQFGAPAPGVYVASGPQVLIGGGAPGAHNPAFPATPMSELQRIAEEAQRRQAEFAAKAQGIADASAEDNLAVALGTHYGAPFARALVVAIVAALVVLAAGVVLAATGLVAPSLSTSLAVGGGLGALVLFVVRVARTPRASPERCAAERGWQAALPFVLTGYVESLREETRLSFRVQVHLEWASPRIPLPALVSEVVVRCDRGSTAAPGDPFGWVSAELSANHQLVGYVHELVDRVLLPMHRDYPLARVALRRSW